MQWDNKMGLFDQIVDLEATVRGQYLEKQAEKLEELRKEQREEWKRSLGPHEWWKEDENLHPFPELSLAARYSILCDVIISLIDDINVYPKELGRFFVGLEKLLEKADEESLREVEIFLFETLLNYYSWQPEFKEKFIKLLQQKSRLLCQKNEELWHEIITHKSLR